MKQVDMDTDGPASQDFITLEQKEREKALLVSCSAG